MKQTIAVAAAVNNRKLLAECLLRSPDIASGAMSITIYEDYRTAGSAYNDALDAAEGKCDVLVLVHQDVYLPSGFYERLCRQLEWLNAADPSWAVAGAVGVGKDGQTYGTFWTSGLQLFLDHAQGMPAQAESFDEVLLIVRLQSGLRFDPELPSFHLYGTDIAMIAAAAGRSSWILHLPLVHHSGTVMSFLGPYTDAYMYMRRKWWDKLPIRNLNFDVTRSLGPLLRVELRMRWINFSKPKILPLNADVVEIAHRHGLE